MRQPTITGNNSVVDLIGMSLTRQTLTWCSEVSASLEKHHREFASSFQAVRRISKGLCLSTRNLSR